MSDFIEYAKSLNAALVMDLRRGYLRDLSGNGNHGSAGSGAFVQSKGSRLFTPKSHAIVVPDAASLRMSSGTWLAWGDINTERASQYLISKNGIKEAGRLFLTSSSTRFAFYDGADTRIYIHGKTRMDMVGITFVDGAIPSAFVNGEIGGSFSGAIDIDTTSTDPVYIGEAFNNTLPVGKGLSAVQMFPSVLTSEQISNLHTYWIKSNRQGRGAKRPKWFVKERLSPSPVLHIASFTNPIDVSENGNDGVKSGVLTRVSGVYEDAFNFHGKGAGKVTVADAASIQDISNFSFSSWVTPLSAGETAGRIAEKATWSIYVLNNRIYYDRFYTGDNLSSYVASITYGRSFHLAIVHDTTDLVSAPTIYINGEAQNVTVGNTPTLVPNSDVGNALNIGNLTAGNRTFDGWIDDVRLYNSTLTAAQVRSIYLEGALKPHELSPRFEYPISLANESGKAGPWYIGSGTFKWLDDGATRYVESVTAGWACAPQHEAFGCFYFEATKEADANVLNVAAIASSRDNVSGAAQNAYVVTLSATEKVLVDRYDNGSSASTIIETAGSYIAIETRYKFCLVRRKVDGLISLFIKGGAYSSWTAVGSAAVDATHTVSEFIVVDADAADEVANVLFFENGDTIDPTAGDLDFLDERIAA